MAIRCRCGKTDLAKLLREHLLPRCTDCGDRLDPRRGVIAEGPKGLVEEQQSPERDKEKEFSDLLGREAGLLLRKEAVSNSRKERELIRQAAKVRIACIDAATRLLVWDGGDPALKTQAALYLKSVWHEDLYSVALPTPTIPKAGSEVAEKMTLGEPTDITFGGSSRHDEYE
jgi:hypothetical protein